MKTFEDFLSMAEQIAGAKFNDEQKEIVRREYDDMICLLDAEQSAKRYAARRNRAGFSTNTDSNLTSDTLDASDGTPTDPHIAARIRRWARRTNRTKLYGMNE